jgi:hypothetical protein
MSTVSNASGVFDVDKLLANYLSRVEKPRPTSAADVKNYLDSVGKPRAPPPPPPELVPLLTASKIVADPLLAPYIFTTTEYVSKLNAIYDALEALIRRIVPDVSRDKVFQWISESDVHQHIGDDDPTRSVIRINSTLRTMGRTIPSFVAENFRFLDNISVSTNIRLATDAIIKARKNHGMIVFVLPTSAFVVAHRRGLFSAYPDALVWVAPESADELEKHRAMVEQLLMVTKKNVTFIIILEHYNLGSEEDSDIRPGHWLSLVNQCVTTKARKFIAPGYVTTAAAALLATSLGDETLFSHSHNQLVKVYADAFGKKQKQKQPKTKFDYIQLNTQQNLKKMPPSFRPLLAPIALPFVLYDEPFLLPGFCLTDGRGENAKKWNDGLLDGIGYTKETDELESTMARLLRECLRTGNYNPDTALRVDDDVENTDSVDPLDLDDGDEQGGFLDDFALDRGDERGTKKRRHDDDSFWFDIEDDEDEGILSPEFKRARYKCIVCREPALFACGTCEKAIYCGRNCQAKHFETHAETCK